MPATASPRPATSTATASTTSSSGRSAATTRWSFGSASGFGTIVDGRQVVDLTTLSPRDGFILQGETGDNAGINVSAAGDVNGDGFDDLIVGANQRQ